MSTPHKRKEKRVKTPKKREKSLKELQEREKELKNSEKGQKVHIIDILNIGEGFNINCTI